MKLTKQLIGTLFTVASAGLAFGCGCQNVRLEPVREMIIPQQPLCVAERTETISAPLCPTGQKKFDFWAPFQKAGHVISTPFVAMGNALTPSNDNLVPVGERLSYETVTYPSECGSTTLLPVGERITTVRTYRNMELAPVGERLIIRKSCYNGDLLPVGERFIITKSYQKQMLSPVGERTFIVKKSYHKQALKPVGERTLIVKSQHKQMLKPVGERTLEKKVILKKQDTKNSKSW